MHLSSLLHQFTPEVLITKSRPYVNHSVAFKKPFTAQERAAMLDAVGLNVFYFPAEMITGCDLLSDSGTTTMTNEQWASLHLGDEAYGSNKGYFVLREQIQKVFGDVFFSLPQEGKPNAFLFHQARSAESALFSQLAALGRKLGKSFIIPSNGHFDTTRANIEINQLTALDFFSQTLKDGNADDHFKGNMDSERLRALLQEKRDEVPLIYITVTNNTGGGQPVSMQNIHEIASIAHAAAIPFFLDACRFAENAWFIQRYEEGYHETSIAAIVREMFSCVDGFTISFKKDGLVNMGGGLFLRSDGLFVKKYPQLPDALMNEQITKEGHPTYGGMSGRDIMALATGLQIVLHEEYLTYRIQQVHELGTMMLQQGIPVLTPFGGHAVYLDMNRFFVGTSPQPDEFRGIGFTALLLAAYGHRACELGHFAFGVYDPVAGKETIPEVNFVRFAVPRLRYEHQDLQAVAESVHCLYQARDKIPGVVVTYGKDLPLRHFKARFRFKENH
ncbi:tryptophanase [Candidatus Woesearchaeota archaeon]|nr:tryptophanase [Candidatus Woesearchaeota archaeon]